MRKDVDFRRADFSPGFGRQTVFEVLAAAALQSEPIAHLSVPHSRTISFDPKNLKSSRLRLFPRVRGRQEMSP